MNQLKPINLPEIMPSLRILQASPFGNMHVKISIDLKDNTEREIFAQLGKGGDLCNSDLEAICRLISLFLRCNGSLGLVLNQLLGIGSSLTVPSKDGTITSLADALAKAIVKYLKAKKKFGLENLLLGKFDLSEMDNKEEKVIIKPKQEDQFKVKCPECSEVLSFSEGCVKCNSCGYSKC